jgi:RNase P subunit RPR2
VSGKQCHRVVPADTQEFSFQFVVVICHMCGEQRRYLLSEVFMGRPDQLVAKQMKSVLR